MSESGHRESVVEPISPSPQDVQLAAQSSRMLATADEFDSDVSLQMVKGGKTVSLPPVALRLLKQLLDELAAGHAVAILPMATELTSQQAADILKVSRPFLVKLLEQGELPFRKVGKHRRVLLEDVLAYKQVQMQQRQCALDELIGQAQELNMGY